ncbi:5-dehydro-2-deoxygluconokinase [Roseovarius sp. MMSF_3281]|uniref:bifunctional 5-dehydro-2-deoxygluconokinase/5-dehydro-2- deoxyphosphogluconate aldolase n=1 Tax=Roseovarius sp. MMSF_3281 TaxID=3046694 RepID=UPI00273EF8EA|nr:5-dehydro-2-deoxygluconokinase [Roseovarius sp. MMSF_3281]
MTETEPTLDAITIGRACVDLYADQVGCRMEDALSFSKYVGGCPTNIAIGGARLGLNMALLSRVGADQHGTFVRETLEAEGVQTFALGTDPERLTAMAFLGLEDDRNFPLLFARTDCADAALDEDDVDPEIIARARAVLVTGTHFSQPHLEAASRKAMAAARAAGRKVVFDIDYRPNLWGLGGAGQGDVRFVADAAVTARVQSILPGCDVIVGTDEELHIAGGSTDTREALRAIRARSDALIVFKTGPKGCVVYDGDIPENLDDGISSPGFPVEVFNVLGAGDGFMAGFLRGYLRDLPLTECCRIANACGALAVSRHGCAPSYPTWDELQVFFQRGIQSPRLREDDVLEHVHWATTRRRAWVDVCALALDHRAQFEDMAAELDADPAAISRFKALGLQAALAARTDGISLGTLLDGRYGQSALFEAERHGIWIGRPVEQPGSCPIAFEGKPSLGVEIGAWPRDHVAKCLIFYDTADDATLKAEQIAQMKRLQSAARDTGHEFLLEIISRAPNRSATETGNALDEIYRAGIRPDWWKLAEQADAGWAHIDTVIQKHDPWCRGVLMLGLDAPLETLSQSLERAARVGIVKGFAVGRTIFGDVARAWLAGEIQDDRAVSEMAHRFRHLIGKWKSARTVETAASPRAALARQ